MATHQLLLLAGDGIGPEVMAEVKKLIAWMNVHRMGTFETEEALVGGACYDVHKVAITDNTMAKAHATDAVIFGAVGGPKWDKVPYEVRPEAGLLRLRKDLGLFANIRPAICYPALAESSSLKPEVVDGLDIIIVRELTGGVYFGEPKTITDLGNGQKRAVDTQVYDTYEIERISRVAFELARTRKKLNITGAIGGKRPEELLQQLNLTSWHSGVLFIGEKGQLIGDYERHHLLPQEKFKDFQPPEPSIPKSVGHHKEWVLACMKNDPMAPLCNFSYSGPLTETVLLGVVAYRTGKELQFDAERLATPNAPEAEQFIRLKYRDGWVL